MSDPVDILSWLRISDRLTTSGQPSEEQLATLPALGITHVINLGPHSHERALPDEAAAVAALGMEYIYMPIDFAAPTDRDFSLFCAAMEATAGKHVHVHCIVNARVSAFLYRYRREILGLDETSARQAMELIWKPGGVWAAFIGDNDAVSLPHRYARWDG